MNAVSSLRRIRCTCSERKATKRRRGYAPAARIISEKREMLKELLKAAERGEPLWLYELRDVFSKAGDGRELVCSLLSFDGERHDYRLYVPRAGGEDERRFVLDYLCANVFNMLSSVGGRKLVFYFDPSDEELASQIAGLRDVFSVDCRERGGLGKVVNIADRLCSAFGGGRFEFSSADLKSYTPAPAPPDAPGRLPPLLRAAVERSSRGVRCGVDVGGTDIKAVLSVDGRLVCVKEYDWDPSSSRDADGVIGPIVDIVRLLSRCAGGVSPVCRAALRRDADLSEIKAAAESCAPTRFDAIGLSFPDIVIRDRIVGFETPKMRSIRSFSADREAEFAKIRELKDALRPLCREGAEIRIANDGHMAAFSAAAELSCGGAAAELDSGVIAYALGTDFGTGWLNADGRIPDSPMEFYCFLLDLGSFPSRRIPPEDLRSTLNDNSRLCDARKYLAQSAAFRLAYEKDPSLLDGFARSADGLLVIPPELRKDCLERLMSLAADGKESARELFVDIGRNIGRISLEMEFLLRPRSPLRFVFGRFVKDRSCFELIRRGCAEIMPSLRLERADEELAVTPLMRALGGHGVSTAQFAQAVGAVYYASRG